MLAFGGPEVSISLAESANETTALDAPKAPATPEETGVEREYLIKLLAKILHVHGTMTVSAIAREMRLPQLVVAALIKDMQKQLYIEAKGVTGGDVRGELRYALGGRGHEYALDAMAQSKYVGPAPVTLDAFIAQVGRQSIKQVTLSRHDIVEALSHLVLPYRLVDSLGPAFNSARSILLHGDPGNGKTSIAEAIGKSFPGTIYVPHAIIVGGQTINFFDPVIHTPEEVVSIGRASQVDTRWQLCRRPMVLTGGELTLEMLDLSYNEVSGYYEAPVHIKATGGVFVVDDFGRQRTDPQSVLNRWIIPLERGFDQLTLNTGKKFAVPFDQLVVFSTNIEPAKLADAGALRRLYYKIRIPTPTETDYRIIFDQAAKKAGVTVDDATFNAFFEVHYGQGKAVPAGHHPRYLIDHVLSVCRFREEPPRIEPALLEGAWANLQSG